MPDASGLYRGSVHDISDPEGRGRIRALIPSVLGTAPSGWAEPMLPAPETTKWEVGDRVWILFEGGDINRPVYLSRMEVTTEDLSVDIATDISTPKQTFSEDPPFSTEGYPEGYGWWQVEGSIGGEEDVVGFWRMTGGEWVRGNVVTADALKATNALIDALSTVDLTTVNLSVKGDASLTHLTSENTALRGNSEVASGGVLHLRRGTTPPVNPLAVVPSWESKSLNLVSNGGFNGMWYQDGWYVAAYSGVIYRVYEDNSEWNSEQVHQVADKRFVSIARVSNHWCVLDVNQTVTVLDSNWTQVGSYSVAVTDYNANRIITDGTHLIVIDQLMKVGHRAVVGWRKRDPVTGAEVSGSRVTTEYAVPPEGAVYALGKVILTTSAQVYVLNPTTGARETQHEWPAAEGQNLSAIFYDGTHFYSYCGSGYVPKIYKYTNDTWTNSRSRRAVVSTWYDDDYHETDAGAEHVYTPVKRARTSLVQTASVPSGSTGFKAYMAAERGAVGTANHVYRTNLVTNPSFEVNTSHWAGVGSTSISRSTAQAAVGTASLSMSVTTRATATVKNGTTGISVTDHASYAVQARLKSAVARSASIQLQWYTAGGGELLREDYFHGTTSTTAWTTISGVATAPAGAALVYIRVNVYNPAIGEVHYVDAVMLERASVVGSYFDGATAASAGLTHSWTGTAHLSTSVAKYGLYSPGHGFAVDDVLQFTNGPAPLATEHAYAVVEAGADYFKVIQWGVNSPPITITGSGAFTADYLFSSRESFWHVGSSTGEPAIIAPDPLVLEYPSDNPPDTTDAPEHPRRYPTSIPAVLQTDSGGFYVDANSDGSVGSGSFAQSVVDLVAPEDSEWIDVTFASGWSNWGSQYQTCQYRKIGNIVYLRGLAKETVSGTSAKIFDLPEGFRPPDEVIVHGTVQGDNTGAASAGTAHTHENPHISARININSLGEVTPHTISNTNYVSLTGIYFFVD